MDVLKRIFERKSEALMFCAGAGILASVLTISLTGDFIFWKFAKFFYALGVIFIIFDR